MHTLRRLAQECICLLFGALQQQLCLQGEPLIEPGQLLWELFMLRRGSLSIKRAQAETIVRQATMALNSKWNNKNKGADSAKQHTCAKKQRRGAQSDALYARILDKPGQYTGLVHPFQKPPRAVFRVAAIKQCQLMRVTQSTVWKILSHFGPEIQERFCESLRDHYDATLAALRLPAYTPENEQEHGDGAFRKSCSGSYAVEELIAIRAGNGNQDSGAGAKGASTLQKQADVNELQSRIGDLQSQLETCQARTAALQETAATLPATCEMLQRVTETFMQRPGLPALPRGLMGEAESDSKGDEHGDEAESMSTGNLPTIDEQDEKPAAPKSRALVRQATKAASKAMTFGKDTNVHNERKSRGSCSSGHGGLQRQATRSLFGSRMSGNSPPKQAEARQPTEAELAAMTEGERAALRWSGGAGVGIEAHRGENRGSLASRKQRPGFDPLNPLAV